MARVTTLALQRVPANTSDFGDMAGCTRRQKMWLVMLPSARRSLLIGINQVIMLSLAAVIVASIIGAGGLGADVYRALTALRIGDAVEAGFAITLLAIALDRISQGIAMRRPVHEVDIRAQSPSTPPPDHAGGRAGGGERRRWATSSRW